MFCRLVVLAKLSVLGKWLARKTPLKTPFRGKKKQSPGLRVFMTLSVYCIVSLFYCVFVLSPGPYNIFHTPTARYSLFVLEVPLNTNEPAILLLLLKAKRLWWCAAADNDYDFQFCLNNLFLLWRLDQVRQGCQIFANLFEDCWRKVLYRPLWSPEWQHWKEIKNDFVVCYKVLFHDLLWPPVFHHTVWDVIFY